VRTRIALTAAAVVLLALPGCAVTSHSSRCSGDVCAINLTGEQTLDVEFGSTEYTLRVGPIEGDAVTVSARGDEARLAPGDVAGVGDLDVHLVSVSGDDVSLQVRPR
jgi:hypothetical protein